MSRFFPHPGYAEDQPFSHTVLATHVLSRGFQAGAGFGSLLSIPIYLLRKPASPTVPRLPFTPLLLRSAGNWSLVGSGLLSLALMGRMWGKEPIEWADRSWRLLENKGQVECDDWGYSGAVLGAAATYFSGSIQRLGWRGFLGGTGLGSLAGVSGYMIWRHGINGGKWEEDKSLSR
jgi:hypothetical protein